MRCNFTLSPALASLICLLAVSPARKESGARI